MTVSLIDASSMIGADDKFSRKSNFVFWESRLANKTKEGYIQSPATVLEHEMAHKLGYLKDPVAYTARAIPGSDKQYESLEERRVITGLEAKTARANGEYPLGYVRSDHEDHGSFWVSDPTQTSPESTSSPQQEQVKSSNLLERFLQWFNN